MKTQRHIGIDLRDLVQLAPEGVVKSRHSPRAADTPTGLIAVEKMQARMKKTPLAQQIIEASRAFKEVIWHIYAPVELDERGELQLVLGAGSRFDVVSLCQWKEVLMRGYSNVEMHAGYESRRRQTILQDARCPVFNPDSIEWHFFEKGHAHRGAGFVEKTKKGKAIPDDMMVWSSFILPLKLFPSKAVQSLPVVGVWDEEHDALLARTDAYEGLLSVDISADVACNRALQLLNASGFEMRTKTAELLDTLVAKKTELRLNIESANRLEYLGLKQRYVSDFIARVQTLFSNYALFGSEVERSAFLEKLHVACKEHVDFDWCELLLSLLPQREKDAMLTAARGEYDSELSWQNHIVSQSVASSRDANERVLLTIMHFSLLTIASPRYVEKERKEAIMIVVSRVAAEAKENKIVSALEYEELMQYMESEFEFCDMEMDSLVEQVNHDWVPEAVRSDLINALKMIPGLSETCDMKPELDACVYDLESWTVVENTDARAKGERCVAMMSTLNYGDSIQAMLDHVGDYEAKSTTSRPRSPSGSIGSSASFLSQRSGESRVSSPESKEGSPRSRVRLSAAPAPRRAVKVEFAPLTLEQEPGLGTPRTPGAK